MEKTIKTKIVGTETFINSQTGELIEMQVIESKERDKDFNFHKLFMKDFICALDIIGNQKMKVALWVINNINKNNQLLQSYRDIADETQISYVTVAKTMKTLLDADFLRKSGKIMIVNPDILFKGTAKRRCDVLHTYKNADCGDPVESNKARIRNLEDMMLRITKQIEQLKKETPETTSIKLVEPDEKSDEKLEQLAV